MKDEMGRIQQKVLELFRDRGAPCAEPQNLEITINFHPDRLTGDGQVLLSAIVRDGFLRNQFETGTSNGGLTAFVGGDRWNWEHAAFSGIYDYGSARDRPKYGALNHRRLGAGGSPRFGSCYFVLKSSVLNRTTFCYPESWLGPTDYGYADRVANLIRLADSEHLDLLDNYIEAHTHYRGTQYVALAHELAVDGVITPDIIGNAVNLNPQQAQYLKKVWHYLARFGNQNSACVTPAHHKI